MVDRGTLDINRDLSFVDPRIRSQAPVDRMVVLPPQFTPGNWDVICQRGRDSFDHSEWWQDISIHWIILLTVDSNSVLVVFMVYPSVGNRRFRICIENNLARYSKAKSKLEKSLIVMSIVDNIRESSTQEGGGFVKQVRRRWVWFTVERGLQLLLSFRWTC